MLALLLCIIMVLNAGIMAYADGTPEGMADGSESPVQETFFEETTHLTYFPGQRALKQGRVPEFCETLKPFAKGFWQMCSGFAMALAIQREGTKSWKMVRLKRKLFSDRSFEEKRIKAHDRL